MSWESEAQLALGEKVIASTEAEQAVLGAVLLGGTSVMESILTDVRLAPDDFWREGHTTLWRSMLRVMDAGGSIDALTVTEDLSRHQELEDAGGRAAVDSLSGQVPDVGNVKSYARRVRVLADLRRDRRAGLLLAAAAESEDKEKRDQALAMMLEAEGPSVGSSNPEQLAELLLEHLEAEGGETFSFPWDELNEATHGGARRGEVIVVAAHSSHGKTVLVDQFGAHLAEQNLVVHAWINEMTRLQRACRIVAAPSGVPFSRIVRGRLSADEEDRVKPALKRLPFGITECAGWSAEEIARDIRRRRPDVAVIDILHLIPHSDEKDIARISRVLNGVAKQANCLVIVTAHLNEGRKNPDGTKPAPTLGDIRGSGSIKNDADIVLFVFRAQEEGSGQPKEDGWVYTGKIRNGAHTRVRVVLNPAKMQFEPMMGSFEQEFEG